MNLIKYFSFQVFKYIREVLLLCLNSVFQAIVLKFDAFNENATKFCHIIKFGLESVQSLVQIWIHLLQLLMFCFLHVWNSQKLFNFFAFLLYLLAVVFNNFKDVLVVVTLGAWPLNRFILLVHMLEWKLQHTVFSFQIFKSSICIDFVLLKGFFRLLKLFFSLYEFVFGKLLSSFG